MSLFGYLEHLALSLLWCLKAIFAPSFVWYLQGLLTPVIAAIAVYIAWQQWKANELKSKLDLFDRRFKVFLGMKKILSLIFITGTVNDEQLSNFVDNTEDVAFLFGDDIRNYQEEIYRRAQKLSFTKQELSRALNRGASVEERSRLADSENQIIQWATAEREALPGRFKKYLDISKM